jgi:glycosidase
MRKKAPGSRLQAPGLLFLAACASGGGMAPPDGAPVVDAAPEPDAACQAVPQCGFEVATYAPGAASVSLRGDFAPDGWTQGIAMTREGERFIATLPDLPDGTTFEYKFVVDGSWIVDAENPRSVPDGAGGRNSVAYVDCDRCPVQAFDWRDAILYFVLVDRFANGDPGNDAPVGGVETPANYQGGDLAGVLAKLREGYFDELGVNVLWLSCPFQNAAGVGAGADGHAYSAYHGYWPTNLETIDPRVGTEAVLREVIDEAHARGLKVVLDYVMNHMHEESALVSTHPDWFWPPPGEGGCVCGEGCSWDSEPDRFKCWFRPYLPDFDFRNEAARYYSVTNAADWAQRLGLDGYRLDAVKHIDMSWLTDLRERLSARVAVAGESFYLVGETYTGDRGLLKSFIDPATKLDGQFDFPHRAALVRHLLMRQGTMGELMAFLDDNDAFYGGGSVMGTFLGNHDLPRAVHLAEDQPLFGDWDGGKTRAWSNQPQAPAAREPYERLAVAYAVLLTTPGAPLIYYGDEVGMAGAGDPDNRRMMQFDGWSEPQTWLRDRIAAYAKVRATHEVLRRGRRATRGTTTNGAVYAMVNGAIKVWVAVNRGDNAVAAEGLPAGSYRDLVDGGTVTAPLDLPPRSALILEEMP